ncbi:MAG: PD-(D/E)XK nuclease family protein, partial [Acutalibacteraceae bacterium]|nr:PD-(D/E)XK nuclease family protein [Acutalibacteraceae bacterium]
LITEDELQVLDENAVKSFLNSDVGSRLLASDEVVKEYEFAIFKDAKELYDDLQGTAKNEKIVVQGKLDCAFKEADGYVLIDYKTDNTTNENYFVSVYKNQLEIYADALYQCTEIAVKEIYIYSFKLKKFIKVN